MELLRTTGTAPSDASDPSTWGPEIITIDGSEANEAAIKRYNEIHGTDIIIRQEKYLKNVVE